MAGSANQGVDLVGTVHDMRWVFLDNDTKILFASTYDGDWDPYIDDFGTKIPDILDLQFGEIEGWPGIRSPKIKDFIVEISDFGALLVRRQSEFDGRGDQAARENRHGGGASFSTRWRRSETDVSGKVNRKTR